MNIFSILANGQRLRKLSVQLPYSKKNWVLLELLFLNGFIKGFFKSERSIFVLLGYQAGSGFVSLHSLSSPGRSVFYSYSKLPYHKNGLGTLLLSTSKGVMTDRDARFLKLGGKVLPVFSGSGVRPGAILSMHFSSQA